MKEKLYKKFTAVPTRPGRGGTYPYIKWQDVADRMNEIFGIQWTSEVVYQDVIDSNVIIRVRVTVLDADTGDMFFQEGFGGAPMDDRQEAGNPFKAAYSKALKDACKKWGIGLYLEDEEQESTKIPNFPTGASVKPPVNVPRKNVSTTKTPPPFNNPVKNSVTIKQYEPQSTPPSFTPASATQANVTEQHKIPPLPPTPNKDVSESGGEISGNNAAISDVQKAAVQSILNIQGVEYNDLVKDAFILNDITLPDNIPTMDNLLYDEAVKVIQYGNNKFRKQ